MAGGVDEAMTSAAAGAGGGGGGVLHCDDMKEGGRSGSLAMLQEYTDDDDGGGGGGGDEEEEGGAVKRQRVSADDDGRGGRGGDAEVKIITPTSTPVVPTTTLCGVCKREQAKYTCPRCMVRTCSLACVKDHKRSTSCDGKRDRTKFMPVSSMTEADLRSDYTLLEETLRQCESARRTEPPGGPKLPVRLAMLTQAAAARTRGTRLLLMPQSAQRRRENTTALHRKNKHIQWRIEWFFPRVDATLTEDKVHEEAILGDHLARMLTTMASGVGTGGVTRHRLRHYRENIDALRIVMKVEQRPANAPTYVQLDTRLCLRQCLSGLVIIGFPKLIVVLSDEELRETYGIAADAVVGVSNDDNIRGENGNAVNGTSPQCTPVAAADH